MVFVFKLTLQKKISSIRIGVSMFVIFKALECTFEILSASYMRNPKTYKPTLSYLGAEVQT